MYKLLIFLACFAACKSKSTGAATQDGTTSGKAASFSADEMDFVDGCVENAKANLGEEKAFVLCKCILLQVKKENPSMDSVTLVKMMNDTAKIGQLAKNCK